MKQTTYISHLLPTSLSIFDIKNCVVVHVHSFRKNSENDLPVEIVVHFVIFCSYIFIPGSKPIIRSLLLRLSSLSTNYLFGCENHILHSSLCMLDVKFTWDSVQIVPQHSLCFKHGAVLQNVASLSHHFL